MIKEKYIQTQKETAITVTNSMVESIRKKNVTYSGLRIYDNDKIGISGAIGKHDEAELEKSALETLKQNIPYPCEISGNINEKVDMRSEIIKETEFPDEMQEVLRNLRQMHPDYLFSNKIKINETTTQMINDNNLNLEYHDRSISFELIFKEKFSSNIMDGFIGCQDRKYNRKSFLEDSSLILDGYKRKLDYPGDGIYPIIFSTSMTLPFTKFITDLNGKMLAAGSSLFSSKLGQKVFNDSFTFCQSLNPDDVYNLPFFDAEGTVNNNYRYPLIENGIIKTPYTDKRTSKMFNLTNTGSAAAAYDGVPNLQFLNYKVRESENTLEDLLGGDKGIIILFSEGGDFTPTGDFGSPVQAAFMFDGKNIIGRLPEFQISSNVFDMFGSAYRGVSKDSLLALSNDKSMVMDLKISKL